MPKGEHWPTAPCRRHNWVNEPARASYCCVVCGEMQTYVEREALGAYVGAPVDRRTQEQKNAGWPVVIGKRVKAYAHDGPVGPGTPHLRREAVPPLSLCEALDKAAGRREERSVRRWVAATQLTWLVVAGMAAYWLIW